MKIAVTSPSFSKHPDLVAAMNKNFVDFKLNTEGKRFNEEELIDYLKGYDAAIVGLDKVTPKVIDALPEIKMYSKYGVGLDNIDLDYCKQKNVAIGWSGGVNRTSVAEMTLGNILSLLRNMYVTSNLLKKGIWQKDGGEQLSGKTIGIIGVGYIGKELIRLLQPFNCKILVNDVIEQNDYYRANRLIECDKDSIFREADVISLHTPLTTDTKYLINASSLAMMKENAVLINSARGGLIQENDLYSALKEGKIAGAALDVYEEEPPTDKELISLPNLINTPHIGGNAKEAVYAMGMSAIEHLLHLIG